MTPTHPRDAGRTLSSRARPYRILGTALQILAVLGIGPAAAAAQTNRVAVEGETYCITHDPGFPISGTYLYEGAGAPKIVLASDGTGTWENHGTHPVQIRWGVEAEPSGAPKKQEGPAGVAFRLWYQALEPFRGLNGRWTSGTPGEWDVVQIAISFERSQAIILGERVMPYRGTPAPTRMKFPPCASAPLLEGVAPAEDRDHGDAILEGAPPQAPAAGSAAAGAPAASSSATAAAAGSAGSAGAPGRAGAQRTMTGDKGIGELVDALRNDPENPLQLTSEWLGSAAKQVDDPALRSKIEHYASTIGTGSELSYRQMYWDLNRALARSGNGQMSPEVARVQARLDLLLNEGEQLAAAVQAMGGDLSVGSFLNQPYFREKFLATGLGMKVQQVLGAELLSAAASAIADMQKWNAAYKEIAAASAEAVHAEADPDLSRALIDAMVGYTRDNTVNPMYRYDFESGASLRVEGGVLRYHDPARGISKDLVGVEPRNTGTRVSKGDFFSRQEPVLITIAPDESRFWIYTGKIGIRQSCSCLADERIHHIDAATGEVIPPPEVPELDPKRMTDPKYVERMYTPEYMQKQMDKIISERGAYFHQFMARNAIGNVREGGANLHANGTGPVFTIDGRAWDPRRAESLGTMAHTGSGFVVPGETQGRFVSLMWAAGPVTNPRQETVHAGSVLEAWGIDMTNPTQPQRYFELKNTITGIARARSGDVFYVDARGRVGRLAAASVVADATLGSALEAGFGSGRVTPYDFTISTPYLFDGSPDKTLMDGMDAVPDHTPLPSLKLTPDEKWLVYTVGDRLHVISTEDPSRTAGYTLTEPAYGTYFSRENGEVVLYTQALNAYRLPVVKKYALSALTPR